MKILMLLKVKSKNFFLENIANKNKYGRTDKTNII